VRAHLPERADSYVGVTYGIELGWRHLLLDLHVPAARTGAVPVVVYLHGGGWLFGARDLFPLGWPPAAVVQGALDAGLAIALVDYRLAREAPFPAQLHDVKAAIRYLRAFGGGLGVDPARVGVWGESAGGHLAALAALVRDPELEGEVGLTGPPSGVSATVCFFPITDVTTMPAMAPGAAEFEVEPIDVLLEGSPFPPEEARRLLSPAHHVGADAPPMLLVHGDADTLVPVEQSRLLAERLRDAGAEVEFDVVPEAGHGFAGVDAGPQIERAVQFLARRLAARP
jgi:acetyl esterase/lipase